MSYHQRRLRLHGLIRRRPGRNQYLLTHTGLQTAAAYTLAHAIKVDTPRPDTDGHGDDAGTRADLSALVLASQRAGIPVQLAWDGADLAGVDGRIRRAVHRVVREALTNVHKHAPGAATRVLVEHGAEWIRVEVRNDLPADRGRPAAGTSMGLVGLQERVRLVGGTIRAGANSDRSLFVVAALLPLTPATVAAGNPDGAATPIDHPGLADRQTPARPTSAETAPHIGSVTRGSVMRRPTTIILSVLAGTAVVCCGGGYIGAKILANKVKSDMITPATYQAVRVGQPEDQVVKTIGTKGSIARDALQGQEPPIPAGAHCSYALPNHNTDDTSQLVYRFCFAGGKLVEKQEIHGSMDVDPSGK